MRLRRVRVPDGTDTTDPSQLDEDATVQGASASNGFVSSSRCSIRGWSGQRFGGRVHLAGPEGLVRGSEHADDRVAHEAPAP